MKKLFALILALAMLLTAAAFAEEEEENFPMPEEAAVFEGMWVNERVSAEIIWEEAGFRVYIEGSSSAAEKSTWEYNCLYNEEDSTVASIFANGIRTDYVYDEKGEETFTTAYEDGAAVFSINEKGHLVWKDLKDDNGEDMEFRNLFTGMWACERATMEISCEEEGYKVFINWGSNASEVTEWAYSCTLNFLDNALVAMPFGTRTDIMFDENGKEVSSNTVYEDGKATFALTEEGGLTWKDAKEDAGNGMVFEWVQEITLGL